MKTELEVGDICFAVGFNFSFEPCIVEIIAYCPRFGPRKWETVVLESSNFQYLPDDTHGYETKGNNTWHFSTHQLTQINEAKL